MNENLFTESGFSVPSGFKGGTRRGSRRSNRGRKRKAKEISDSDDSDGDNQSYDEGASDTRSEGTVYFLFAISLQIYLIQKFFFHYVKQFI